MLGIQASALSLGSRGAVFSNGSGLTATYVGYGDAAGKITGDAAFTRVAGGASALVVDSALDATATFGNASIGFATGGTAGTAYWFQRGIASPQTNYCLSQANSTTVLNATTLLFRIGNVTKGTLLTGSMTFASGVPVTISDNTASSSSTTGALIVSGGGGFAGQITCAASIIGGGTGVFSSTAGRTTASGNGQVAFWRSGGTIGTAGDCVLQADPGVTAAAFVFRAGPTTPITIATLSPAVVAGTTPALAMVGLSTITGGVTDGYNGSLRLTPTYDAGSALTVTRHDYIDLNGVALTGAGPAALTDAAVFRFDAAIGTHKATASNAAVAVTLGSTGPTGSTAGAPQGWIKINVNGTLRYIPCW